LLEPLTIAERKATLERYARLLSSAREEIGERPLVLPNKDSFPDRFTPDARGLATLVGCMLRHAGLDDVPVITRVVEETPPEGPHGACSSGCQVPAAASAATPRLAEGDTGWTLNVPAHELGHPVVLTTMIARALGHVILVEALPTGTRVEPPADLTADYAAVALGFGPLLLEGAYVYSKSCGGPQVVQVTSAALAELAWATALFIEMRRHSGRRALAELGVTQQAALREELEWARSNETLVERLVRDPERVALGDYTLREPRPWLLRVLGGKPKDAPRAPTAVRPRQAAPLDPAHAELRALVDEALGAAPIDAE
jgi:hypothetical protein